MSNLSLRWYQEKGIDEIRECFRRGIKKVLLWLATGGGKTHCFSYMMIEAVERKRRCLMIVRGRKLVDQASKRLFHERVTHGVLMAGHWNFRPHAPIQICSIDTLMSRGIRPKADLIVIDEAHQAVSDGYKEFLKDYPDAFVVAVTATPYTKKGLRHVADAVVHPITTQQLIDEGFLVPPRYFAPAAPSLSGVRVSKSTGDYVTEELAAAMDKGSITGDIVSHWKKLGIGRPTVAFCVNVAHSKHVAEQFNAAGIPALHADADTPDGDREKAIKALERGDIKVVTNVGIFCTGVDIPPLACIIMARPTMSGNLYIQQAGRGTRPNYPKGMPLDTVEQRLAAIEASSKHNFILLDHAGNVTRHGFITYEQDVDLDGQQHQPGKGPRPHTCQECFGISAEWPCPLCGWQPVAAPSGGGDREVIQVAGELKEITGPTPIQRYEAEQYCEERLAFHLKRKHSPWQAYYNTREKYGEQAARLVFFRLCKQQGIDVHKKKQQDPLEVAIKLGGIGGYPFK